MAKKASNRCMLNAIPAGYESDEKELDFYLSQLKIKRLEDITHQAGIDGLDFDATLDGEMLSFFNTFREKWNMCSKSKSPFLAKDLSKALVSDREPLLTALKIFANCPDSSHVKPKSLSHFVLDTACKLQEELPHLSEQCDRNTSMIAFNFIKTTTGLLSLNQSIIKAYRLYEIRDLLLPKLKEMLANGHCKEVTQWAINLNITHEFDMMEIAFPLLAQEKLPLAEEYLDQATNQRLPFVKFLDSLLHKNKSVMNLCEPHLGRYKNMKICHNVLSYRPVAKVVARLAKKYGYDEALIPNYKFTKTSSHLHYLFREYEKSRINLASYRELVSVHAQDYPLQVEFVSYVANAHAYNEALYWINVFKIKPHDCPFEIKSIAEKQDEKEETEPEEEEEQPSMYLTMDLPDNCLIIVDTAQQFEAMMEHLQQEHIIYLDSEWMQNVCLASQLCLLQLATSNQVYLIDCLAHESILPEHWRLMGANIFNNTNIIKVGFSITCDLAMLQRSLPLQLRLQTAHHYLDLRTVWLELKKQKYGVELPFGNVNKVGEALTDLTLLCLGKKLNKSNQCSNWANRPLRREQILYAAIDARCLMLVYNILIDRVPFINSIFEKSVASNNFIRRGGGGGGGNFGNLAK
ncbi:uncharacterized protein Dwil_GK21051 [Drosophila willistoni]|uniref:3'-5' exonuclease domain-containing protein n=1 Tax=Drosophila willistoni TaxID=7260 RepID=B4N7C5_DROWI|nr:exonuclease mut-7 homolog [Drosophila willistoni]EDW80266.2 uncharacterized protein Dwil_GK21051 [Drosophila willistoni]